MHTALHNNQKLKQCAGIIKNDVQKLIKTKILPSHSTSHLQGHFSFRKLFLEYAFDSFNIGTSYLVLDRNAS